MVIIVSLDQYSVYLVSLDPTVGHEIKKTRPCVIISPDEMNRTLKTIMIAPMTTKFHPIPSRVRSNFSQKTSWIILDQIRTIDRRRIIKKLGEIRGKTIVEVKNVLKNMLID